MTRRHSRKLHVSHSRLPATFPGTCALMEPQCDAFYDSQPCRTVGRARWSAHRVRSLGVGIVLLAELVEFSRARPRAGREPAGRLHLSDTPALGPLPRSLAAEAVRLPYARPGAEGSYAPHAGRPGIPGLRRGHRDPSR